ncbi:Uma2 family endonuclease, partial [Dehalococcoidia bacterium]|nr:Uma2 family endonuclease [Dehalococcoidia bacterium]
MWEAEIAPVAELYPPQGQWTERDYFTLPDTNRYIELSEGGLVMPPHPPDRHQAAILELAVRLRTFVLDRNLGLVRIAPLPVRLWPGKIREPDIFFLSKEHADRAGEKVYGVPDLVIEVLSPGTEQVDRGEKYFEYARAGVREYWMVDPDEQTIEVYILRGSVYQLRERFKAGELVRSELLSGFETNV